MNIVTYTEKTLKQLGNDFKKRYGNMELVKELVEVYKTSTSHKIGIDEVGRFYYVTYESLGTTHMIVFDLNSVMFGSDSFEKFKGDAVKEKIEADKMVRK